MKKWFLHKPNTTSLAMVASMNEKTITPEGDNIVPLIGLNFSFTIPIDDTKESIFRYRGLIAVAAELYLPGNIYPWIQTGFIKARYNPSTISVPLSHAIIEKLSDEARHRDSHEVNIYVTLSVLARDYRIDGNSKEIVFGNDILLYQNTENMGQTINIDAAKWFQCLNIWGYPQHRIVPVCVTLPGELMLRNSKADKTWNVACEALLTANKNWHIKGMEESGIQIRKAVQNALFTWHSIWYPDKEIPLDWLEAVKAIGKEVPGFNEKDFRIPKNSEPDVQRVYSRLIILKDLNTLANAYHHVGSVPVYNYDDLDVLLTNTISIMRNLPAFWVKFPEPISRTKGKATAKDVY